MADNKNSEREIAVRAIEAYLTAFRINERTSRAKEILSMLELLGWRYIADLTVLRERENDNHCHNVL